MAKLVFLDEHKDKKLHGKIEGIKLPKYYKDFTQKEIKALLKFQPKTIQKLVKETQDGKETDAQPDTKA